MSEATQAAGQGSSAAAPGPAPPNHSTVQASETLPLMVCIGWGMGTFGVSTMFNSVNLLLLRFATDFLGIAAAAYGVIYLVSKIYDAATDPIMGVLSDRTKSRFGRRRPYLLLGGALSAVAFIALFNAPSVLDSPQALLVLALLLIFHSTGYTVFNVPYLAMPAEMTRDYMERARLISFRVYAIGFGTLAGTSLAPALIEFWGGGRAGHAALAWAYGGLILAASAFAFFATGKARATSYVRESPLSRREKLQLILTNRPFSILVSVKTLHLTSLAVTNAGFIYFVVYVLDQGYAVVGLLGLANGLGMLAGTPIWYALARRLRSKRNLYILASTLAALVLMSWWLATPAEPLAVTVLRKFVHGLTIAGSLLCGQAMLPDAIAQDAARSGLRREGVFSGIFTTAEKMAFAIGGAASGVFLGLMGYVSSTEGAVAQPESAILAIYLCVSFLPAALLLASIAFLIRYDLDEDKVRAAVALEQAYDKD